MFFWLPKITNAFCFIPEGGDVSLVRLNPIVLYALKGFSLTAKKPGQPGVLAIKKTQSRDNKLVSMVPDGVLSYEKIVCSQ